MFYSNQKGLCSKLHCMVLIVCKRAK